MSSPTLLVTGGAGYIGSHTAVQLMRAGWHVVVLDNLVNSYQAALQRMAQLTGVPVDFVQGDVRDEPLVRKLLEARGVQSVIHFAGYKSVGESIDKPLAYHENNVGGLTSLLRAMSATPARQLVFSSSAAVYGISVSNPMTEDAPLQPTNPYGHGKALCERMLHDLAASDPAWRVAVLRYFNPTGAHPSALIGEDPVQTATNLMPLIVRSAARLGDSLSICGDDYPTTDGTGVRDFIHVEDLAAGHVAALRYLNGEQAQVLVANLGTGMGHSVLDLVKTFERVNGVTVPHRFVARRQGDVAACWADATRANNLLGWHAKLGLEAMCRDAWRWHLSGNAAANP